MSRLLYALEDHFSVVAEQRSGSLPGLISSALSGLCAVSGDVLRG
jgi:hypothetical protein